jgi:acyl-CoA thioester hydrolase
MLEVLRSSVNTWECDQMGHLNVRHYFARGMQGVNVFAHELGLGPRKLQEQGLSLRAFDQHIRFHRELRPGAAFTLRAGTLEASAERLRVYGELRALATDEVSATIVSDVRLVSGDSEAGEGEAAATQGFPAAVVERALAHQTTLPEHAAPRGMKLDPVQPPPARDGDVGQRMTGAFLGPVLPEDCDRYGRMLESSFMARVSDGIAHFFRQVRRGLRPDGIGGAALEYRFVYRQRPRVGDLLEVRSGLISLGRKTLHLGHVVYNLETQRCAATSEAVAVSFDLAARKSVDIPDDARAAMQPHLVTGFHT